MLAIWYVVFGENRKKKDHTIHLVWKLALCPLLIYHEQLLSPISTQSLIS